MERSPQLGDLLVSVGVISRRQLVEALDYQRQHGVLIGQALVAVGACSEEDIARALDAQRRNTPLSERLAAIKGRQAARRTADYQTSEVAWRYLQILERELRTASQDVRDVSQILGELALQIEAARCMLTDNPGGVEPALAAVRERLRQVVTALDDYASELAAGSPDDVDLVASLMRYSAHYARCYGGHMGVRLGSPDVAVSRQVAHGLLNALHCLLRGVGNSEGRRDVDLVVSTQGRQVVVEAAFERIQSSDTAMGDPIGELSERVALLGGQVDRRECGESLVITCRAPSGREPDPARASASVVL